MPSGSSEPSPMTIPTGPDPRAHRARDRLDGDPDHAGHGNRDRQRDRPREGRRRRSESAQGERLRAAVLLELQLPRLREQALGDPASSRQPICGADDAREGRPPFVLGAGVPPEAGPRARPHPDTPHHAGQGRDLPAHLYRALRARTCSDALACDRDATGRIRALGNEERAMTSIAEHEQHTVQHGPRRPPGGLRRLLYPGFLRAAWMTPLFFGIGCGIVVLSRWWGGWHPIWFGEIIVLVGALTAAPVGFLAGIGAFDYWARYAVGAPTVPEDHSGHGAYSWKDYFRVNTDHKVIGMQYLVTTIIFFLIGGLLAMLVRAELAKPGMQFFDNQTYNGLFSVHASLMIFLFVIPAFAGLANFVVPLMLGAPDRAFPRLNALSFWLLPIAGIMMVSSFFIPDGAFACGWTGYAPLCSDQPMGTIFFNMGVQWAGASSIMTALNFLVTIITMRAPGMTFWRMPLLVWANFTTSLLVVLATPFIAGSQFFVMFDRILHTHFFNPVGGGYVLGYQHIFWFYSHPAVYIMVLPGFGIISEIISVFARKPIFGYRLMALSLLAILVLGFSVWAHHMFVSGMAPWLRVPMMITTLMIAVPTGIKVFSWLATIWEGKINFATPMLWAVGFVSMFVIGGLSGIYLGAVPIDIHTSDTYFVVAHIHYVLFGGSLFTIFAGIYYWFPKMTGRQYNEKLGKLHFWLTFVGFNLTFFPMHLIGTQGMTRRVSDYAPQFSTWNLFISIASFALGASTIVFLYNMVTSMRRGAPAESNPWRALTLEWQVSSPPPIFNFDEIPQVVGNPYEYGVPGARHAVLNGDRAPTETEVRSH